mgnify:CR=1 FL=1
MITKINNYIYYTIHQPPCHTNIHTHTHTKHYNLQPTELLINDWKKSLANNISEKILSTVKLLRTGKSCFISLQRKRCSGDNLALHKQDTSFTYLVLKALHFHRHIRDDICLWMNWPFFSLTLLRFLTLKLIWLFEKCSHFFLHTIPIIIIYGNACQWNLFGVS